MTSVVRLGDIGSTYGGLTGKTKADFGRGSASFVTFLEVINNTRLRGESLERVRVGKGERQNRVMRDDLLFNGSSETPEEVALSAVVDFDPEPATYLNSFCFGFRLHPDAKVEPAFLAYLFRSPFGRSLVANLAQGATRYNIAKTKLLSVEIPLPSLVRQREIVEGLADADDLMAGIQKMIAKKQLIKLGMMQELLTGKTRLPGFTQSWSEGSFEQLAVPSKERLLPRDVPDTTPLVELEQIDGGTGRLLGVSTASNAVSLKAVFRPGDVLFGKLRAYLRKFWYADTAGLCTTEIWVLRARTGVHSRFVRYVVETERFINAATGAYGTHMPRSDWRTVKDLPVDIPPFDEQVAIATALSDADAEIDLLLRRLEKARDVTRGMTQGLITGSTPSPVVENSQ